MQAVRKRFDNKGACTCAHIAEGTCKQCSACESCEYYRPVPQKQDFVQLSPWEYVWGGCVRTNRSRARAFNA